MGQDPKAVVERFLQDGRDQATGRWRMDVITECFEHWGGVGEAWHLYVQLTG